MHVEVAGLWIKHLQRYDKALVMEQAGDGLEPVPFRDHKTMYRHFDSD